MKIKKEIETETLYAKIEVLLEVLGYTKEDIVDIANYMISKAYSENKNSTKETQEVTGFQLITSLLENNPEKEFTTDLISQETGVIPKTVRTYLGKLRKSKKIKIVGYETNGQGRGKYSYQAWGGPSKELQTVTPEQGYTTVPQFLKKSENLVKAKIQLANFYYQIKKAGLKSSLMEISTGMVNVYKTSELKKLLIEVYGTPKDTSENQSKKVQADIPSFSIIGSLFKKKQEASDLIKF